jgi:hypothetical protein
MKRSIKVLLGTVVILVGGAAAALALASPSIMYRIRGMPAACEKEIVLQLVSPLEAKVIPETRTYGEATSYVVCFQTRTRGGGFGVVAGLCQFDERASKPSLVTVTDEAKDVREFCKG